MGFLVFTVSDEVKCEILLSAAPSPEMHGDVVGQFHSLPGRKDGADSLSTSLGFSSSPLNLIWDKRKNKQINNLEFILPAKTWKIGRLVDTGDFWKPLHSYLLRGPFCLEVIF